MSASTPTSGALLDFLLSLQADITARSIAAGQKATGATLASIEASADDTKGILQADQQILVLENGRGPTVNGGAKGTGKLQGIILAWIQAKPGFTKIGNITDQSLAFLITRKINEEGTALFRKGGNSGVISGVITDDRIDAFMVTFANIQYNNYRDQSFAIMNQLKYASSN